MLIKWDVTIPALTGDAPRKAYIYLPEYYDDDPNRRFPVMYMCDGQNVFLDSDATYGKSWGMYDFMQWTRKPLIIVAVECNRFGERFNDCRRSECKHDAPRFYARRAYCAMRI